MLRLNLPPKLETERLLIQRLRYEDAEEIFYCYASKPEATRYVAWATHQSLVETRGFLRYAIAAWEEGIDYSYSIRLKDSNRLIGSFGVVNENGKVQFGYIFTPTLWGMGFATEVCREMVKHLRADPTIFRIGTVVDVENFASISVLKKSGLVEEARLSDWIYFPNQQKAKDCFLYVLRKR